MSLSVDLDPFNATVLTLNFQVTFSGEKKMGGFHVQKAMIIILFKKKKIGWNNHASIVRAVCTVCGHTFDLLKCKEGKKEQKRQTQTLWLNTMWNECLYY